MWKRVLIATQRILAPQPYGAVSIRDTRGIEPGVAISKGAISPFGEHSAVGADAQAKPAGVFLKTWISDRSGPA
jgi:hypothetical protein